MNSINIALNVLRRLSKEKAMLLYLLVLPLLAGILVTAINSNNGVKLGIVDRGEYKRLAEELQASGGYSIKYIAETEAHQLVEDGKIKIAIKVEEASNPEDSKPFTVYSSAGDTIDLLKLEGALNSYLSTGRIPAAQVSKGEQLEDRMALGFLTMFMLMFISTVVGTILEDRREKTMMRTFSGPIKSVDFVLGHLMVNVFIGIIQIVLFLLITKYVIRVDWQLSLVKIFGIMLAFLITAVGMTIGLTAITKNQDKYSVINTLMTVSTCTLGGSFFPASFMPEGLQRVSYLVPQYWAMDMYDILVSGGSFKDIQVNIIILLLIGCVLFSFGVKILKPMEADL